MPALTSAASGYGLATIAADGSVLDVWFPAPALVDSAASGTSTPDAGDVPPEHAALIALAGDDDDRGVRQVVVHTQIASLADAPADAYDAYLRLHLLSSRAIKPHEASMDGIFGKLTNVVWTSYGPCAVEGFESVRARLRSRGPVSAQRIAVELGGGGHVPAAGASVDGEYATVRARLEEAVARELARVDSAEPAPA